MMDIQREFENFEACMEGHETARDFFEAGAKAALEYARGKQEPVAWMSDWGNGSDVDFTTKSSIAVSWVENDYPIQPLYTHPAQPVQAAGAQEIKGWLITSKADEKESFVTKRPDDWNNKNWKKESLYTTHPAASINEQLLEALKLMLSSIPPYRANGSDTIPENVMEVVNAAIAAADAAKGGV